MTMSLSRWLPLALLAASATSLPAAPAAPLPVRDALDVQSADLDRDGHADLVSLHGGPRPVIRVFYGDATGFSAARTEEAPVQLAGATVTGGRLTLADLNGDGRIDIIVTAGGNEAAVWWNRFWTGRGNLREWPRTPLAAERPASAAVADLNHDGLADLILSGGDAIVYWGAATRTLVTRPPTRLAEISPTAEVPVPPPARALPVPPAVPGAEHIVVHRERGRYSAFPDLFHVRGSQEALYVHFGAGETTSHVESRRQPHDFVSTDGGRTWQRHGTREPNPAARSSSGRLVDPSAYSWRHVPSDQRAAFEARGYEVRNAPDGRVTYCVGCKLRTSADGGATWQEAELPVPEQAIINGYLDAASMLRLDDRTILRAVYGKPVARVRYYESWLLRSEDDGATWSWATIAADPTRDDHGFSETAIAQAANGDIVAMMRIEPPMGSRLWVARSPDRGKTWSKAEETPLRGFPAHLLRLRDGRLLCTYGYREAPIGIRAAISRDHGRTWREQDIVSLRSDGSGPPSDNGYPQTAELADGTLVTVCYLTRDGITGVEATRWTAPWN